MSIRTTNYLECDCCGAVMTHSDGDVSGSKEHLYEKAVTAGWDSGPTGDYCPICFEAKSRKEA